jgi:hypothetical protein
LTQAPTITVNTDGINAEEIFEYAAFVPNMGDDGKGTGTFGVSSITVSLSGRYRGNRVDTDSVLVSGGGNNPSKVLPVVTSELDITIIPTYGISQLTNIVTGKGYDKAPTTSLSLNSLFNNPAVITVNGVDTTPIITPFGTQSNSVVFDNRMQAATAENLYKGLEGDAFFRASEIEDNYKYYGKTCYLGRPTHLELSAEEYQAIQNGAINWTNYPTVTSESFTFNTLGHSGIIILNESQSTVNNKFEGYYVAAIDNSNYNPATDFNGVLSVNSIQDSLQSTKTYLTLPNSRLGFPLSADKSGNGSSVSEIMENLSNFDLSDNNYSDTISLGVFKLRKNVFSKDVTTLDFSLAENYVGSIDFDREIGDTNGGSSKTFSLEKVSKDSRNLHILINPYLSDKYVTSSIKTDGNPSKKVRFLTNQLLENITANGYVEDNSQYIIRAGSLKDNIEDLINSMGRCDGMFPVGVYDDAHSSNKTIGNLPLKLERALELVDNSDVYPIDLAVEAGLGTIFVNAMAQSSSTNSISAGEFLDSEPLYSLSAMYVTNYDSLNEVGTSIRNNYTSVANVFINVAEKQRKDFLVILDPLRNIFVQGDNSKIINSKKIWSPNSDAILTTVANVPADGYTVSNFSQHIYWPLRHQFGTINCSYATTYANWAQVSDVKTGLQTWIPFSGIAAAIMANTDSNFQPWYAPAGFTRGIVTGVNDIAIYPKQKQRDQLYKISLNPVTFFPNEGFTVFGQKTLLKRPSAFDRINVRRLFLALEKATKNTAKFFVFEPNTLFTRTQVINVLAPIFENAKNTEGLYDYRIICDERNNTPDVIDNNELKIDIYIQPVRTAEFILVNFYATRTGTNFDELIGS